MKCEKKIHLIMPMAGRGSRFSSAGYDCPKPLIPIYGKPFFYWAVQSIRKFVSLKSLCFVVLQEHVDAFSIDTEIRACFPEAEIVVLPDVTAGAVMTCLEGCRGIGDDCPVVFNDCDHLFKSSRWNAYCAAGDFSAPDGILLTFRSDENKYSFLAHGPDGNVIRTVEKQVISNDAICGCYYFKNAETFRRAADGYIHNCPDPEFFMSGVYNALVAEGKTVRGMATDYHIPFGVPEEYVLAENDLNYKELL